MERATRRLTVCVLKASETRVSMKTRDEECRALATCGQVTFDFGEVRPFINIRDAEARRIETLCSLFARCALAVPANARPGGGRESS